MAHGNCILSGSSCFHSTAWSTSFHLNPRGIFLQDGDDGRFHIASYNIIYLDDVLIAKNPVNPGVLISSKCSEVNALPRTAFENKMGMTVS